MSVAAEVKPEAAIRHGRVGQLMDPRSPSTGIDRTPIQVGGPVCKTSAEVKSECPLQFSDPRSPSIGITRTPVREVMRATVGSFARRLGMIFHNESEDKVPQKCLSADAVEEETHKAEEPVSSDPLLPPQCSLTFSSLDEHANLLATSVPPPPQSLNGSSPFVLLDDEPQVELEIETEADISLEEAEEARETPLHKRLSMSLITYHEGAASSFVFAEVHNDNFSSPVCGEESQSLQDGVDHSYALPALISKPESAVEPSLPIDSDVSPVTNPPTKPEAEKNPSPEQSKVSEVSEDLPPSSTLSQVSPAVPSPEESQHCTRIRCPTIDPRSPSQVVFKPQWLGKGFGGAGQRARGVQNHVGKGGSSPLAVRVAVKNATNENKGQSGKLKQKGNEGRSPLQILKETNSPREQRSQKLKVSTPDKQRLGQMDRRMIAVSLDKENR